MQTSGNEQEKVLILYLLLKERGKAQCDLRWWFGVFELYLPELDVTVVTGDCQDVTQRR